MGFRYGRVQFKRAQRGRSSRWKSFVNREIPVPAQDKIDLAPPSMGKGEVRVFSNSLLNILSSVSEAFPRPLVVMVLSMQQQLKCLRVHGRRGRQSLLLLGRDLDFDLPSDCPRDLALQDAHIAQVALVALGPKVPVALAMDQLSGDTHSVTSTQYCPFYYRFHVTFPRDLRHRFLPSL